MQIDKCFLPLCRDNRLQPAVDLSHQSWIDAPRGEILENQVHLGLGVLNTVHRPRSELAYLSVVIGGGRRLYEAMERHGYLDPKLFAKEKLDALLNEVIEPNKMDGSINAARVQDLTQAAPLIVPSAIQTAQPRWEQPEFMGLWLGTLSKFVTQHFFPPGWEYGNGTVEEFVYSASLALGFDERSNITMFDMQRKPIAIDEAAMLLRDTIVDLNQRGFATPLHVHKSIELGELAAHAQDILLEHSEHKDRCNPRILEVSDLERAKCICFEALPALERRYNLNSFAVGKTRLPNYSNTPDSRRIFHREFKPSQGQKLV